MEQTILIILSINNVIRKPCAYTLHTHQQRYLSAPDLGHRYQIRYKWFRSLEASSSILAITHPRILAILAELPEILQHNMSDAYGSADAPLANLATPAASVAPTAGTSDSDAQTPVIFTVQMHKELTAKFKFLEEERNAINRKLTEMHTSVAADSLVLHGLPDLIDKKLTSHHQSLTRLMDENIDDFLGEVTDYVDGKVPANAASALAPAAAVPGFPLGFGPSIQFELNRSFARAARSPPADAIRIPSPICSSSRRHPQRW